MSGGRRASASSIGSFASAHYLVDHDPAGAVMNRVDNAERADPDSVGAPGQLSASERSRIAGQRPDCRGNGVEVRVRHGVELLLDPRAGRMDFIGLRALAVPAHSPQRVVLRRARTRLQRAGHRARLARPPATREADGTPPGSRPPRPASVYALRKRASAEVRRLVVRSKSMTRSSVITAGIVARQGGESKPLGVASRQRKESCQ